MMNEYRQGWIAGLIDARGMLWDVRSGETSPETWAHVDEVVTQINTLIRVLEELIECHADEIRPAIVQAQMDVNRLTKELADLSARNDRLEAELQCGKTSASSS